MSELEQIIEQTVGQIPPGECWPSVKWWTQISENSLNQAIATWPLASPFGIVSVEYASAATLVAKI